MVPEVASRRVDRRSGLRRVADVQVFARDGSGKRKCRLRDISLNGAFIETENFALAKDSKVDLVLRIRCDGETSACRVPAKVVRTERGGAALMFGGLDEQTYNLLFGIVRPFKQKPAARPKIGGCE